MKKLYMVGLLVAAVSLGGCELKAPTIPEISTGTVLTWAAMLTGTTWAEVIATGVIMDQNTWTFDSWIVPVVTGSESVNIHSGVTAEVQKLINERKTQSGDETKLTEEDIGLMEKIIQKVQGLGK